MRTAMRNTLFVITGFLLLAMSPAVVKAQQPPPVRQPAAPGPTTPSLGTIDIGFRGTSADGDDARYERYRDLSDGAYSRLVFGQLTDQHIFNAQAFNVGYRDQRYQTSYNGHNARFTGLFDSTPLNYSYLTATPWVEASPDVFTLNLAARQAVQAKTAIGVPQNVNELKVGSIYPGMAVGFDLQSKRDTTDLALAYDLTQAVGFNVQFINTRRSGQQPYGASFSFNNANELPMSIDNRTNDVAANLEWTKPKGMLRIGYSGSWFTNNLHELVWDNPIRATDTNPYDPSGYSNGNGPAQGRMALPPSNTMNAVNGMGLYKMPGHTTVNGTVSFTTMNQNDPLIPWTINSVINSPSVWASFPNLQSLPRATAEAEVHGVNALVNLTSRPTSVLGLMVRYRYNDHVNKTPIFDGTEYVRFDAVPEETGGETEHFNITENTLDVDATFRVMRYTSLRIGYGYDTFNRTGRSFSDMTDNIFRTSLDVVGNQYVTVRGIYEFTSRKGSGFSEDAIEDGGSQPGLRFYDEADKDRNRGTLLFSTNPIDMVSLSFSMTAGKDTYKGPGHEFGLLDAAVTTYNAGVNVTPNATVGFGANYGHDHYATNQKSRNANPPPDPTFTDPSRDWTLNNEENVNNINVYLDLLKIASKTDVRVSYDFSESDNGFTFGGPRIAGLTAANQFLPVPNVTNSWHRFTADVQHYFARQVGVGVSYWYEKFEAVDFNSIDVTGQPGTPRLDYLGELSTGYGNRPYNGQTAVVRLLYRF